MKTLRDTEKIIQWLFEQKIYKFNILDDFKIDVQQNIELRGKMSALPVEFNVVEGHFICSTLGLTTLKGCPSTVMGDFNCSNNKLTSLEFSPQVVNSFNCVYNELQTLKGIPEIINGDFYANKNKLIDLKYIPKEIMGNCVVAHNRIKNIDDWPHFVQDQMDLNGNALDRIIQKKFNKCMNFTELSAYRLEMALQSNLPHHTQPKKRVKI